MSDDPVPKFPIATVVEISIIGVFPASEYLTLQALVEKHQNELRALFESAGGRDSFLRWAEVRPATKEEVLRFTPRKMHFTGDGHSHACDTKHVQNTIADRVNRMSHRYLWTAVQVEECIRALHEAWAEGYIAGRRQGDDDPTGEYEAVTDP
jgi:hypothetical protein